MDKKKSLQIATRTVDIEGRPVRYKVVGEGDPIILVHGLSASSLWWTRNVPALAQHYRLYLVDLPGFGSMSYPRNRFALKQAANWLLKWMEAIGLQKVHFIGHSMGGYISLWIAAHHPTVVSHLVLVSPAVAARVHHVFGYLMPLLVSARYLTLSFFPILLYDALRAGPFTIIQAASDLLTVDVRQELKIVTAPTLLVWGEHDTLVPLSVGYLVRNEMQHAHFLQLKQAGHVSMYDRSETFNAAVLAFLRGEQVGEE